MQIKIIRKSFEIKIGAWKIPPFAWTLGLLLFTIVSVYLILNLSIRPPAYSIIIFLLSFCLFVACALISIAANIIALSNTLKSLGKICILYIELLTIFGVLYFWFHISAKDSVPIEGITPLWTYAESLNRYEFNMQKLFEVIVDIFHFSVVTMTTLGYGDMLPKSWYAKLVVDIQVLVGLAVLVLGIGTYFGNSEQ